MNASGALDTAFGIRSFVMGTGGITLSGFASPNPARTTSEVRNSATHGVMKFTLHDTSYDWQFIPIAGRDVHGFRHAARCTARPGTMPPVVDAGPDQTVAVRCGILKRQRDRRRGDRRVTWSQVSGPGRQPQPSETRTPRRLRSASLEPGVYVLQLTANDGQFVRSDTVTVSVTTASGNLPPTVDAGPDQTITLPAQPFSRERPTMTVFPAPTSRRLGRSGGRRQER